MTTLILTLIKASYVFQLRPLYSTAFTSLAIFSAGETIYFISHEFKDITLIGPKKEEILSNFLVPALKKVPSLILLAVLMLLLLATIIIRRDEFSLCSKKARETQRRGSSLVRKRMVLNRTTLRSKSNSPQH